MGPNGSHKSHESHWSDLFFWAGGGFARGVSASSTEDEDETLDQADEVEKKTGPEIEHAAPGVANFAVAGGSQETGPDIVIDLLL